MNESTKPIQHPPFAHQTVNMIDMNGKLNYPTPFESPIHSSVCFQGRKKEKKGCLVTGFQQYTDTIVQTNAQMVNNCNDRPHKFIVIHSKSITNKKEEKTILN